MIKKFFTILLFVILFAFNIAPVFAADDANSVGAQIKKRVDDILPSPIADQVTVGAPKGDLKYEIIPQAINIFLAIAGTISFIVFVYAGIMLVVAQGNEEEITKFKNILIWSIVGLLFITAAYALVRGVMNLSFT